MTCSYDWMLDKRFHGRSVQEILDASPAALRGVSAADARRLDEAFGIKTVRELACNRFLLRAQAILAGAGTPGFDAGPSPEWDEFFAAAPLDYYKEHPASRFRLDFGPVFYRGRLDGSGRVIVVGQDPSTNEILGHRVFVGRSGQRVQGFLRKLGITRSYTMLNTFLYSVFGQFDAELQAISLEDPIRSYRNTFLDRLADENSIQAVIAVGRGGRHAVQNWPGSEGLAVFEITHPAADEAAVLDSWNACLPGLQAAVDPDDDGQVDPEPYGSAFASQDEVPIPRFDFPFLLPEWHGVGAHSYRDGNKMIIWTAP